MIRKISERYRAILSTGEDQKFIDEYLKNILENSHRVDEKYYRSILMLLFAIVSFELLTRGSIAEASIGFFRLKDLSLLHKYVPVAIAYFSFTTNSFSYLRESLGIAYREGMRFTHQSIVESALWLLLAPSSPILAFQIALANSTNLLTRVAEFIVIIILSIVLPILPLFFEVYAFYRCFCLFGIHDFHVWLSAFISTIFVMESLLIVAHRFSLR